MSDALATLDHGDPEAPRVVILLHGRNMTAADLAPFASSLNLARTYVVVPDAPALAATGGGRTWWPMDARVRPPGGADLAHEAFPGREIARRLLAALVATHAARGREVVLVGFSQGGMLALDHVLVDDGPRPAALALLSTSRIALDAWTPRAARLRDLPIFVAHGRGDQELAFAAGEGVRDFAIAAGARVTWLPFDGPHEIPLVVWRGLRKFLGAI